MFCYHVVLKSVNMLYLAWFVISIMYVFTLFIVRLEINVWFRISIRVLSSMKKIYCSDMNIGIHT